MAKFAARLSTRFHISEFMQHTQNALLVREGVCQTYISGLFSYVVLFGMNNAAYLLTVYTELLRPPAGSLLCTQHCCSESLAENGLLLVDVSDLRDAEFATTLHFPHPNGDQVLQH
jgi:hypothetical protein